MVILEDSFDRKLALKKFRGSCSAFIKKPLVRKIILEKFNNKCCECSMTENLQIDHVESVLRCFKRAAFHLCNSEENLQVLCGSCNASKLP